MLKTILLVDDEIAILDILMNELSDLGTCMRATDGASALEMIRHYKPDLIISDYKMPGLNGLELMRSIKESGFKIPVIWISGQADTQIFQEAWRMGVFEFYQKPVNMALLRESAKLALDTGPEQAIDRRPLKPSEKFFTTFEIELPNSLVTKAKDYCRRNAISLNTYLTHILSEHLEK